MQNTNLLNENVFVESLSPAHLPSILQLLPQVLDPSPFVRNPASNQLLKLESCPGYCSLLLEIASNRSINDDLRTLALVCVKNAVKKHWRPRDTPALQSEEKENIRKTLLSMLEEPSQRVGQLLSFLIGKIARRDWPQHWPNLVSSICSVIQNGTPLGKLRATATLHQVVSNLISKVLVFYRQAFHKQAAEMFPFVENVWDLSVAQILSALALFSQNQLSFQQLSDGIPLAQIATYATKILNALVIYGFVDWSQAQVPVVPFLAKLQLRFVDCVNAVESLPANPLTPYIHKFVKLFGKLLSRAQKERPLQFTPLLPHSLEFCYNYLKQAAMTLSNITNEKERLLVNCLIFIKNVIEAEDYREGTQAYQFLSSYFDDSRLQEFVSFLISRYIVLSQADLNEWQAHPEEFLLEEKMDAWQYKKRPCAEVVYLTLLRKYKQRLAPWVVEYVKGRIETAQNMEQLLLKDACYAALGLGYWEFVDLVPFNSWFHNVLRVELTVSDRPHAIIRRRIGWLLSQWVLTIDDATRPKVYESIQLMLQDSDVVVRLTGAECLETFVADTRFLLEPFMPFVEPIFKLLFQLLHDVSLFDSKLKVLEVLKSLIEALGDRVRTFTPKLVEAFVNIWNTSKDKEHSHIKIAIIECLTALVKALKEVKDFYPFLIEIIQRTTTPGTPEEVYLVEDGLILWITLLDNVPSLSPELLQLYPNVTKLMLRNYDHTKKCMKILENYILLGQADFVSFAISDIVRVFERSLGDVKDNAMIEILKPIEIMVTLFSNFVAPHLENALIKILSLIASGKETPLIMSYYFGLFARLLLHNQSYFLSFFQRISSNSQNPRAKFDILGPFIEAWIENVDHMAEFRRRKCSALALTSLITVPELMEAIPEQMAHIIVMAIGVMADEEGVDMPVRPLGPKRGRGTDSEPEMDKEGFLDFDLYGSMDSEIALLSLQARTWFALYKQDPINTVTVRQYLVKVLKEAETHNRVTFNNVFQRVDPLVRQQLEKPPDRKSVV